MADGSLQGLLRQKELELEERGRLLLKSKYAIEQLQQQLQDSAQVQDDIKAEARQGSTVTKHLISSPKNSDQHSGPKQEAYEDQVSLVRVAQAQVEACEDELNSRSAELDALQAGLAEAEEARNAAVAQTAAVREECRQRLATVQAEAQAAAARAMKEADAEIGAAHAEGAAASVRARQEADSAVASVRASAEAAAACAQQEAESSAALIRQEAQAMLALARQEADSRAAASQLESAAHVSRIRQEASALVAAAREDAAAAQVEAASAVREAAAAASATQEKLQEGDVAIASLRSRLDQKGAELASAMSSAQESAKELAQVHAELAVLRTTLKQAQDCAAQHAEEASRAGKALQAAQAGTEAAAASAAAEAKGRSDMAKACERRLARMQEDCMQRIKSAGRKAERRVEQAREAGALQLGELQGQWKARLSEAQAAHADEVHALQRQMRQALKDARGQAEDDLAAAHRQHEHKMEEAVAAWGVAKGAAEKRFVDGRDVAAGAWLAALQQAQTGAAEQLLSAQQRWSEERQCIEDDVTARLAELEARLECQQRRWHDRCDGAQAAAKQMRKELEGRLNLMAGKIAHAARKDAKRKAQLESAQVRLTRKAASEARQAGKAQELETALREASSLFKAEMAVKAAELHALHAELGRLRGSNGSIACPQQCSGARSGATSPARPQTEPPARSRVCRSPVKIWISAAEDSPDKEWGKPSYLGR